MTLSHKLIEFGQLQTRADALRDMIYQDLHDNGLLHAPPEDGGALVMHGLKADHASAIESLLEEAWIAGGKSSEEFSHGWDRET